jgi:hypothetical protein
MSKSLGYFGLDGQKNQLIGDIEEFFGQGLADMGKEDKLWLIANLARECWMVKNQSPRDATREIIERIDELEEWHAIALIQALLQDL